MSATRLVAIRHGQTAWNAEWRLQGQTDIPLDAMGRLQAGRLADALRHEGLVAVVSSDLARALDTAHALAGPLGLPVRVDTGLRERHFGMLEGQVRGDIAQRWPDLARRWHAREPDFAPPGAETLIDFNQRCLAAVRRQAQDHEGGAIAVVSHGGVLDCLYRAATGLALDLPRTWPMGNAAIHRLLHTGQGLSLTGWNDTAHLLGLVDPAGQARPAGGAQT